MGIRNEYYRHRYDPFFYCQKVRLNKHFDF